MSKDYSSFPKQNEAGREPCFLPAPYCISEYSTENVSTNQRPRVQVRTQPLRAVVAYDRPSRAKSRAWLFPSLRLLIDPFQMIRDYQLNYNLLDLVINRAQEVRGLAEPLLIDLFKLAVFLEALEPFVNLLFQGLVPLAHPNGKVIGAHLVTNVR